MSLYVGSGTLPKSVKVLNGVNYNNFEKLQVNEGLQICFEIICVDDA